MMAASSGSNRSVCVGRGPWEKVNLPIFKDKKSKDEVTYCSWECDVAIFHQSWWDDQHLLPYILNDVLQMVDKHYGVIMMFDALSKELYSLR